MSPNIKVDLYLMYHILKEIFNSRSRSDLILMILFQLIASIILSFFNIYLIYRLYIYLLPTSTIHTPCQYLVFIIPNVPVNNWLRSLIMEFIISLFFTHYMVMEIALAMTPGNFYTIVQAAVTSDLT
jgi:hypothetical protein